MAQIKSIRAMRGGMLMELLLSITLVGMMLTFIFQYQQNLIGRTQNAVVMRRMSDVQTALERYIAANRTDLLKTVGRNITRVKISDLVPFGLSDDIINDSDKFQLRILKSNESDGRSTLQGVVVMNDSEINAVRTREMVAQGGIDMGFVDGTRVYGGFGTWHTDAIDLGLDTTDGIIGRTTVNKDNALYLWRVPSDDSADSTMMTALNMGGHNVLNVKKLSGRDSRFDSVLSADTLAVDSLIFQNRMNIDDAFYAQSALVSGGMSADSRSLDVSDTLFLSDIGKFSSFTTNNLWVTNMTLGGLSISSDASISTININQTLDMVSGHIKAITATVGFSGSITPRLVVSGRITDSVNSNFYWDSNVGVAHFLDVSLSDLNHMARFALRLGGGNNTVAYQKFNAVIANKNATASDYMNAIIDIQSRVRAKYRQLNLE